MKGKHILSFIASMLLILFTLTSCQGNKDTAPVSGATFYEETVTDGVKKISYRAQIYNNTIYDITNVKYKLELYMGDELVEVIYEEAKDNVTIHHDNLLDIFDSMDYRNDFDSIKVSNISYESLSFLDTYMSFIIAIPAATIILCLIIVIFLIKNKNELRTDSKLSSLVIIISFVLIAMGPTLGWIPVIFLVSAILIVFLTGYITYREMIKGLPKDSKPENSNIEENTVIDAEVVDAKVVDTDSSATDDSKNE